MNNPILISSQTEDHVPSVIWIRELIGQTEAKTRAGIEGTTAKVYEAYRCNSRGEVIRSNTIYFDGDEPRLQVSEIQSTFPRLYAEVTAAEWGRND